MYKIASISYVGEQRMQVHRSTQIPQINRRKKKKEIKNKETKKEIVEQSNKRERLILKKSKILKMRGGLDSVSSLPLSIPINVAQSAEDVKYTDYIFAEG